MAINVLIVEIEPLRITQHPTDKTKHCKQGTMLAVRASGGSGELAYQWIKNGEPFSEDSDSDYIGVYSDTLQFLSLATEHSGTYMCRVSDEKANCIIESKPAVLTGTFKFLPNYKATGKERSILDILLV